MPQEDRIDLAEFRAELRRLCKGRGLLGPDLGDRIGPALHRRMSVAGLAGPGAPRRAVLVDWLESWLRELPEDLRLAARVALGLHPRAARRFLSDRVSWLAGELDRDERTVRRRIDEALDLLTELMTDRAAQAMAAIRPPEGPSGWYFECVRSVVRLDTPGPEVFEERRVVATVHDLDSLVIAVSLPVPGHPVADRADLFAEVVFGGRLSARERPSESLFRFLIDLPRAMHAGDRHDLALRFWLPPEQPMAPHYALTPLVRCDRLLVRVKFADKALPAHVWRVDGVTPRMLDDAPAGLPEVTVNRVAEAEAVFTELALGHAYGLRWG